MSHLRLSVSAFVALTVVLAVGSQPVPIASHHGARRRAVTRVARGGAQRLDAAEGVGHDGQQHDPSPASVANGDHQSGGAGAVIDAAGVTVTVGATNITPWALVESVELLSVLSATQQQLAPLSPAETKSGCPALHTNRGPPTA